MIDNTQKLGLEFANYLSEKLKKNLECIQITRIFGGASRETFLVELLEKENNDLTKVILRRSQKSSLIETDQETEYKAYSVFQNSDVPVPKLITLEKSSKPLGAPFLVMEQLEGEAGNPFDIEAYKPHLKEIGQQFWSILGTISCLDISKKELETFNECSRKNVWKQELDYWVKVIEEDSLGVEPILEAGIRELYRSPPPAAQRISLVHGDYRSGNFLVKKNKITGVLDWEMAHLGDPLEDLAWALSPLWCWQDREKPAYLINRDKALEIWKKVSGLEIIDEALSWWELFSCVKGLAIWISAGNEFSTGNNPDPVNLFSAWVPGDIHTEVILNTLEAKI